VPSQSTSSLMYDDDVTSFEDLPPEALSVDEKWGYMSCYSCNMKEESKIYEDVRLSEAEESRGIRRYISCP
jgi:hypothetical protein